MVAVACLPPPSGPEQELVEAVDALAGQSPTELAGPVALDRTRVLLAQAERLSALALQALSDVERRELYLLDGATSAGSWVQALQITGVDRTALALARRLHTVPAVAAALRAGQLSARTAAALTAAAGRARPFLDRPDNLIDGQAGEPVLHAVIVDGISMLLAEQTGGAPESDPEQAQLRAELQGVLDSQGSQQDRLERALLLYAQRSSPAQLSSGLALLLDALLPAQHDARARRAHDQAGLDLHRKHSGSGWTLRGELDDETGELLFTLLGAEHAVDPANPTDTNAWRTATSNNTGTDSSTQAGSTQAGSTEGSGGGPDLTGPDLAGLDPQYWPDSITRPRSTRTQRHDALRQALRRLLGSALLGTRDKVHPHLAVTVNLDTINDRPGALPARAASGTPLARTQLGALLCTSTFTRLVLDTHRKIVQVSHTQRTPTATERLILSTQWAGCCSAHGCPRSQAHGDEIIPHHVLPYRTSGTTSLQDLVPLCTHDHHQLHDNNRSIHLKNGRWITPHGWGHPQRK